MSDHDSYSDWSSSTTTLTSELKAESRLWGTVAVFKSPVSILNTICRNRCQECLPVGNTALLTAKNAPAKSRFTSRRSPHGH